MFLSGHYAGDDLTPKFLTGEYWKKVHGPVFMYLNSSWDGSDPTLLWEDAKVQVKNWMHISSLIWYLSFIHKSSGDNIQVDSYWQYKCYEHGTSNL